MFNPAENGQINALRKVFEAKQSWDPTRSVRLQAQSASAKTKTSSFADECKDAWHTACNASLGNLNKPLLGAVIKQLKLVPFVADGIVNTRKVRLNGFEQEAKQKLLAAYEAAAAQVAAAAAAQAAAAQAVDGQVESADAAAAESKQTEPDAAAQDTPQVKDVSQAFTELAAVDAGDQDELGGNGQAESASSELAPLAETADDAASQPSKKKRPRRPRRSVKTDDRADMDADLLRRAREQSEESSTRFKFVCGDVGDVSDQSPMRTHLREVEEKLQRQGDGAPDVIFFDPPQLSSSKISCFDKPLSDDALKAAATNLFTLLKAEGMLFCICNSEQMAILSNHFKEDHTGGCQVDPIPLIVIPHSKHLPKSNQKNKMQLEATSVHHKSCCCFSFGVY